MAHCSIKYIFGASAAALAVVSPPALAQSSTELNYKYDFLGRLIEAKYTNGFVVQYEYDKTGNRKTVVVTDTPGGGGSGAPQDVNLLFFAGLVIIPAN